VPAKLNIGRAIHAKSLDYGGLLPEICNVAFCILRFGDGGGERDGAVGAVGMGVMAGAMMLAGVRCFWGAWQLFLLYYR